VRASRARNHLNLLRCAGADYEAGKRRRYELPFAVNGGAYALAIWLAGETRDPPLQIGGLTAQHIGLGMAASWYPSMRLPARVKACSRSA
jgi:hypothetical protein